MKNFRSLAAALLLSVAAFGAHAASFVSDYYLNDATAGTVTQGGTYKCALVSSLSGYARTTHTMFSAITTEVTGSTGYTAGGVTVIPTFAVLNSSTHGLQITIPAHSWPSSTITAVGEVCYFSTGTASTSPVVLVVDFGGTVSSTAGTYSVTSSTITFTQP